MQGFKKLVNKKQIHQNIIVTNLRTAVAGIPEGAKIVAGCHIHLPETGDLITATDICTQMLYEKFTGLEFYNVISKDYASMWNCATIELKITTQVELEKIYQEQNKHESEECLN